MFLQQGTKTAEKSGACQELQLIPLILRAQDLFWKMLSIGELLILVIAVLVLYFYQLFRKIFAAPSMAGKTNFLYRFTVQVLVLNTTDMHV